MSSHALKREKKMQEIFLMKRMILFGSTVLLFFAIAIGCGHPYKHPYKPESEWDRDYAECEYEAEIAVAGIPLSRTGVASGVQKGFTKARLIEKCMKLKGYH